MRKILALALSAAMMAANAQPDYQLTEWIVAKPLQVAAPFMNDSINPKGDKFKPTNLLDNHLRREVTGTVQGATNGALALPAGQASTMHVMQTNLRSHGFGKPSLKVTSQVPFKVYVDGKEVASKLTTERDSITPASTASYALRLEPEHDVTITLRALVSPSDSVVNPTIQAVVTGADSLYASGATLLRRFALDDTQYGSKVTGMSMSPDGKYLITKFLNAYSAQNSRAYSTLTDTKSGKVLQANLPSNVKWMPSGSKLYYTATAADGFDLFEVDPITGAQTLMAESIPTEHFNWSPDGKWFIYSHYDEGVRETGALRRYASPDDRMPTNRQRWTLQQFDLATGMTRTLTYGNHTTSLLDIASNGQRILVMTSNENPQVRPFYEQTIYELDLNTLKADTLVAHGPSFVNSGLYSPKGDQVLFLGSPAAFNGIGKNCGNHPIPNDFDVQAYVMTLSSKEVKAVSRDFNPNIKNVLCWDAADGQIYLYAEEGFGNTLWRLDPATAKYTRLPQQVTLVNGATMGDRQANYLAYFGQGYEYTGQAWMLNLRKGTNTLIADPRAPELAKINLGKVEPWKFTANDGTEIDGVICLPPDFDPTKKYPLIVYYYGGTSPTQRSITQPYTPQLFASRNYVVYVINPSGTTGYGQEFSARHVNAWGKQTADDIITGVTKFCEAHPFVDSTKIGCLGASYGGFMTQYLQTLTPMFAAAVSHAGISNVTSYWGEGYWGYSYNSVAAADSYPWTNPELFTKQGSLFNADKIHTPLLLLHGTADTNVPIGESIQLFNALRILGRPVEFISVDGENHFISDYPKRKAWQNSIMAWFEKWLKGDSAWWDDLYPARNL